MDTNDLQRAFLRFLERERGLAGSTVATYGHHLRGYLRFLKEAGLGSGNAGKDNLAGYVGGLRSRGLGNTTLYCATIALKAFHRFLVEKGYADSDIAADLPLPRLAGRVTEPLSVEDVERLLAAVPAQGLAHLRDRAILELLYCGLRLGEAVGLDVEHVHLPEEYVKVRGKGNKERLVPIGDRAVEALDSYLDMCRRADGPLFLSRSGQRLGKNGFWRRFKRHAARAGIKRNVHPHLLRHSCACHLLAGRADLRSIQMILGHASLATTQKYLGLDFSSLQETCRRSHPRF